MTARAEIVRVDEEKARSAKNIERLTELWNHHYGDSLEASTRLFAWTLAPSAGRTVALFTNKGRQLRDFVIASHVQDATTGAIDALLLPALGGTDTATATNAPTEGDTLQPDRQPDRQANRELLLAAEGWLREQGAIAMRTGGGPWSLIRGSLIRGSTASDEADAFPSDEEVHRIYRQRVQDMALDVSRYVSPTDLEAVGGVVHPAQPRDRDNIATFLGDLEQVRIVATNNTATIEDVAYIHSLIATDARVSDLMLLWTEKGLQGICQIIFADSSTPLERAYPYTLMRPWAALGVVAVHASLPDGTGKVLLDAAIRRLHNNGINACVATDIVSSTQYEELGFRNFLNWDLVVKNL